MAELTTSFTPKYAASPDESRLDRTSGQTQLNDCIYVCSISEYNLPEYESCLQRRPQYLVLLVSDYDKIQLAAELFSELIKKKLPGIKVLRPDKTKAFNGADLKAFQTWLDEVLVSQLATLPQALARVCNLTGGTKVMALALMTANIKWNWLEYKADRVQKLQMIEYYGGDLRALGTEELPQAEPLDVARLYSEHVRINNENTVIARPASVVQAQKFWDGLERQDAHLLQLLGSERSGLEMLWMYGLNNADYKKKWLEVSAMDFVQQPVFSQEQLQWLQPWSQLAPDSFVVREGAVKLAGNTNKRDDFRRWLSGDWLEQLAYNWLAEEIPTQWLSMNVSVRPKNENNSSTGERESDILVHYKGRTSLVEVKTDLPPGDSFANAIRQLASITDRFGRTNKVLLVGPQLVLKYDDKFDDLKLRCNAEGILLAHNKLSLLEAVLTGKQPNQLV